jgi:hypoxanthine phosphoribosyltransferase
MNLLYTEDVIKERVKSLGKQITFDYRHKEFVILGVLTGAFIFVADLARQITGDFEITFIDIQSYGDDTQSSGECQIGFLDMRKVLDKHVLIVDDIADTGLTLKALLEQVIPLAKSVKTCVLFHKQAREQYNVPLDYIGFEIEDRFIFGYGLDNKGKDREQPCVYAL